MHEDAVVSRLKPNAHRHAAATGRLTRNAAQPVVRCNVPSHGGRRGPSLPYIHSAVMNWPAASISTTRVSHTFIAYTSVNGPSQGTLPVG